MEETKARDAATKDKSQALAAMEESLRAKTKLAEQLSNDINAIRSNADAAIEKKENELRRMDALVLELQKKALDEKSSIESKMQAELDQLRNNSEEAVARLKSELKMQQSAAAQAQARSKQMAEQDDANAKADAEAQRAKQHAENMAKAKAEAAALEEKNQAAQKKIDAALADRPKPKGFGKPAMKAPSNTVPPSKTVESLKDGITAEEAERLRMARVSPESVVESTPKEVSPTPAVIEDGSTAEAAEAVRLERLKAADEAAKKLKKATPTPSPQVVASGNTNPLKQLIMPQGKGSAFPKRETVAAPSSQTANAGRVVGKNPLSALINASGQTLTPKPSPSQASSSRGSINPLTNLLKTPPSQTSSYPERKQVAPPSSQVTTRRQGAPAQQADSPANTILGASSSQNPLTSLINEKDDASTASFPTRKVVTPPSSQASSAPADNKNHLSDLVAKGSSNQTSFPKRQTVAPPSSQASSPSGSKNRLADLVANDDSNQQFIKRKTASAVPSSQSTRSGAKNKLAGLVKETPKQFPKRDNKQASSGSQASIKSGSKLTNLVAVDNSNQFPKRGSSVQASGSQTASQSQAEQEKPSLTDLLPPRASRRFPQSSLQSQPKKNSRSITKPQSVAVKKKSLGDLIPDTGQPIGSYGNRKTTTKLGGMASPGQVVSSTKEARQKAMKQSVVASATVKDVEAPKGNASKADSTAPASYSSLSDIVQNHKARERPPRDGMLKERTTQTKLGEIAKSGGESSPEAEKLQPVAVTTDASAEDTRDNRLGIEKLKQQGSVSPKVAIATAASKAKTAFQRALLSARLANDAKAKVFANATPPTKSDSGAKQSSLSQILSSESKPTLSQQKAFANSNRRTSLFPEKTESKLSSLLKK